MGGQALASQRSVRDAGGSTELGPPAAARTPWPLVLALNFVGYYSGDGALTSEAVARTVKAAFAHVRAYRDAPPDPRRPVGNAGLLATYLLLPALRTCVIEPSSVAR